MCLIGHSAITLTSHLNTLYYYHLSTKIEIKINLSSINGPSTVATVAESNQIAQNGYRMSMVLCDIRVSAILLISFINFILFSRFLLLYSVIVIDFSKGISTNT